MDGWIFCELGTVGLEGSAIIHSSVHEQIALCPHDPMAPVVCTHTDKPGRLLMMDVKHLWILN